MSDNKRMINSPQTEQSVASKKSERNLKRRIAYQQMPTEKKAAVLQQHQAQYFTRTRSHLPQTAFEPLNTLSLSPSMLNRNKLSTISSDEQLNRCPSVYEIGSASTCNEHFAYCPTQLLNKEPVSSPVHSWNINSLPSTASLLKKVPNCKFCTARKLQYESPGFCYGNGAVKLISHELPPMLKDLYFGLSDESNHFHTYIRTYNNMFAFTSLGVKYDKEIAKRTRGIIHSRFRDKCIIL